jgi:hypothetical protein
MPAAFEYTTDINSNEGQGLEASFLQEIEGRSKTFAKHWNYYDGIMPEPLKMELDGYNDNVILAKTDQIADKIVSFLLGDGIHWQGGEGADDNVVSDLWNANRGKMLLHNIALSGALTGHNVVRIEPRPGQMPRIVHINARHFSAFWDASDIDRVLWYRLQYQIDGGAGKRIDYVRGRFDGLTVDHNADGWTEVVWRLNNSMGRWMIVNVTPWEYDWAPIVDWQNMPRPHEYYGMDDVHRAVALNDALNFVASNYNRILKHHSSPKTIGTGFEAGKLVASGVGGFYTVNDKDAKIYNLEMTSDLTSAREFLSILAREMWNSARMTDPQSVKDAVGQLTNFGLRVLYNDAIAKTETKRQLYGEALQTISERALEMSGLSSIEQIDLKWPDTLPEDSEQVANSLLAELAAGVIDKKTYREIRDYDDEEISARLEEEKAGEDNLGAMILRNFEKGA